MAFVHCANHFRALPCSTIATKIRDMVRRAANLGIPAVAITNHGVMCGVRTVRCVGSGGKETGKKVKPIYRILKFTLPKIPKSAGEVAFVSWCCSRKQRGLSQLAAQRANRIATTFITNRTTFDC